MSSNVNTTNKGNPTDNKKDETPGSTATNKSPVIQNENPPTGPSAVSKGKPVSTHPVEIHFGKISCYHYYIFSLLFLSKVPVFWHMVSLIFLSPPMTYKCKNVPAKCPCEKPEWDRSVFQETMQTKFTILCDTAVLTTVAHSIMYFGSLVGAFTFGMLSDKYGRLKMFCVCTFTMSAAGCICSMMPNIYLFILMRWLEGVGVGGAIVTGYVLCVEYCGITQRELVSALYHIPLNVGHMCLPGISYALPNMDHYLLAISIPGFAFVVMYCITLESPKWLMDSNRIDEAAKVMEKIAKWNKTSYGDIKAQMLEYQSKHVGANQTKASFWDLFKYKRLVINFGCMAFIYFGCGMGFYGVSQYIGTMSGNIHLNVTLSGAMLIPATLSCIVLLYVLSRKTFLIITSVSSGCLMLAVVLLIPKSMNILRVLAACLGNCFFFMSFIIVFLYGVELFPTSIRNSVLGVLSVCSRLGQMLAPFINTWPAKISGTIFGVLAILGGVLCIPLPETKNKELPSSLDAYKTVTKPKV